MRLPSACARTTANTVRSVLNKKKGTTISSTKRLTALF